MRIERIEISNFRSIKGKVTLQERASRLFVLVGANNLGKSNILRAINLFFNREVEPGEPFTPTRDLCQGTKKAIISVNLQFLVSEDRRMTTYLDKNHKNDFVDGKVQITLACDNAGRLQYSFAGKKGHRKSLPELISRIQDYVDCIYIPAIKDYRTIIDSEMMRKIVAATFQGWGKGRWGSKTIGEQKEKFKKLLADIQTVLDESGDYVSDIISNVVPSVDRFSFSLPYDNLEDFLGRLLFQISESHLQSAITLGSVGSGVQSFTIYSMLRLLHEIRPTNTHKKSRFIWLIEEPETFMHHDLQRKTYERLKSFSKDGHIFVTTHSPVFIDKREFGSGYVVTQKSGATQLQLIQTKNLREVIAGNLGVSIDDFLDFHRYNLLVEGETDRDLIRGLCEIGMKAGEAGLPDMDELGVLVCGSASSIPHFFGMYNAFSRYADFMALFDRDKSGVNAREQLLGRKINAKNLFLIPVSPNLDEPAIEDVVEPAGWDWCLQELDNKGLCSLKTKQGKIVGYEYTYSDRVQFKREFTKLLLQKAKAEPNLFSRYFDMLRAIESRMAHFRKASKSAT